MKYKIPFLALFLAVGTTVYAGPLKSEQVSPDAKWLVHVDCENLRQTSVGTFLMNSLLGPKLADLQEQLKFNVSNVIEHIGSITAFGADFKTGPDATGVLLINSDNETQKALEGLLVAQILANTNGPVKKLDRENEKSNLYSFANQVFITPVKDGPIIISKSETQIEDIQQAIADKSRPHAPNKALEKYPVVANSFFFLGLANAFNLPQAMQAQAKVLQMAEGGRVALGEKNDKLFLDLALLGKTKEVAHQIQQVIEGMVALVSLGQPNNPELTELAKTIKVASADEMVTLNVEYPADKALAHLKEQMEPKPKKAPHNKPHKKKNKPEQEPAEEPESPKAEVEKGG